jgi:amino acid transporter
MEGMREEQLLISGPGVSAEARRSSITESQLQKKTGPLAYARHAISGLF